jgi:hypothetical protein
MILTEGKLKYLEKVMAQCSLYNTNPTQTSNGSELAPSRYLRENSFHDFPAEITPCKTE